jgi:hypothetical protein
MEENGKTQSSESSVKEMDKAAPNSKMSTQNKHHRRSASSFQLSHDSTESLLHGSDMQDARRRRSAADIERVSYIMAMPREDGSSEPADIMAYQDSQILRLSPDYTSAELLLAEECSPSGAPFLPHEQFASPTHGPLRKRRSTTSSTQPPLSILENEPVVAPETTLQDLNDVERFPEDREDILRQLETLQEQSAGDLPQEEIKESVHLDQLSASMSQESKKTAAYPPKWRQADLSPQQYVGNKRSHYASVSPTSSTGAEEPMSQWRCASHSVSDSEPLSAIAQDGALEEGDSLDSKETEQLPLLSRIWNCLWSAWQWLVGKEKRMWA